MSSRVLVIAMLAAALAASCDDSPPGDSGPACEDDCENVGETHCEGEVIEACAVDPDDGCLAWRSGIDCSEDGARCDDSTEPAICATGDPGTCEDGATNQDETDVDCGGDRCEPCAVGQGCERASDCVSDNCDTGTGLCVEATEPTCTDETRNQDETDVDCGGETCDPCGVGAACERGADCQSGVCEGDTCQPLPGTCSDEEQNQDETDVDCGGATCDPCGLGLGCERADDCTTGACEGRVCVQAESCADEERNQDETDVDCGGAICDPCGTGLACALPRDCASGVCEDDVCVPSAGCTDGVENQDETDVDCGGTICDPCALGQGCALPRDCASGVCDDDVCAAAADCDDGVENQDETDVDCGGATCDPCGLGQGCERDEDCTTAACEGLACVVRETCGDGLENQDETDVDCGGAICDPCGAGLGCLIASDCADEFCVDHLCQAAGTCGDGAQNQDETDVDCGGTVCSACANGFGCLVDGDCRSGECDVAGGVCITPGGPTCADGVQNRDETDVDCGGAYCDACAAGQVCVDDLDCETLVCDLLDTHTCIDEEPRYLVDEDFETGDFSLFPYSFGGVNPAGELHPFIIETTAAACHAGSYCMRSSRSHDLGETAQVSLSLSVREDTVVTFWLRTDLEDAEHYFRFSVDGVVQEERTGVNPWELITVDVPATGPGGPDRVLRWEYSRSSYVSPDHPPRYEVWVDDIDMPAWNTEPSVPEPIRPTNGQLTTDSTPTFAWRSFDPDFDTVTFELQYDVDPSFPLPVSTGETNDTTFTPPAALADGIYYWRVRAKDDSNYRWSLWSPVHAVEVDAGYEYGAIWRQTEQDQFEMNEIAGLVVEAERVVTGTVAYDTTAGPTWIGFNGGTATVDFAPTSPVPVVTSATLAITAGGDFDSPSSEYASLYVDGTWVGTFSPGTCTTSTQYFTVTDVGRFVNDGTAQVAFTTTSGVDAGGCSGTLNQFSARLQYTGSGTGTMTSVPIRFSTFEGRTLWEKVQVIGSGTITIQVLDEAGALIPDSVIPGNAAGHVERTLRLWDLDPMVYPVIRLRALLAPGAALEEWSVVGNDFHEWRFSNDGDAEGWVAADRLGAPAATVSGGVLRFASTAAGEDPRVEHYLPQPLDSARFTTVEVRLRTSTTYFTDDPSFWWWSNYGEFDVRRSITVADTFLVDFQDILFDLTLVPTAPDEPWRGDIEAIRIDPVDRFVDEFGAPADGWFEIDRIVLR